MKILKTDYDDFVFYNEEMVDISGNSEVKENKNNKNKNVKRYTKNKDNAGSYDDGKNSFNNGKDNGNNKKSKKKVIIISSVAAAVVVALGITGFCLLQGDVITPVDHQDEEFTYSEDILVSGISISGKTMSQAKALLESRKESFIKPVNISVDANGEIIELTESDFEYTYDIDAVLSSIKKDEENTEIEKTTETKTYDITATVTADSIEKKAKEIGEETDKEPENACVSKFTPYAKNRFEYTEAKQGCKLNTEDLNNQLTEVFSSGVSEYRIIADVEKVEADITTDDIKKNVVALSTYETVSYNTANGTSNMKVSLEACNGSVIEPGATWSFNKCTGDSNLESNGYKSAHVISEGKIIDGIGGGICQSSSTIYNAAVRANMDIEERYNHMWASTYVPTGLDATIDYPNLDLKLSNPTDYQMFMECKVEGTTLTVTIWGYKSPNYDVIKTHNEITEKGGGSYTVKAWRIYYKDGKEIDRESLGSSTYDDDNGYVFYSADNDSNAKNADTTEEPATEPTTKQSSSSQSSSKVSSSSKTSSSSKPASSNTSSKPASSSSSSTPTEKPTEIQTDPPVQTDPPAPKPSESHEAVAD